MQKKKDFIRLLICLGSCMAVFALWIVVLDPFYHYHGPWFNNPIVLEEVVYQTPGNARNLPYSSAIVGTSMTENFRVSWFDEELGWDTMKLSYAGASSSDIREILKCVYEDDRQVEHIVMDLNDYQLTEEADRVFVERPGYLYNKALIDDYRYLYNHDVFVLGLRRELEALQGKPGNIETAYTWNDEELFGKERVLEASRDTKEMLLNEEKKKEESIEEALALCQENLDNILPIIKEHPETEYCIFFAPYSMIYWEQIAIQGELEKKMDVYRYAIEKLLELDNVKVFYFQGEEMIDNLDEYRDATHYKPEYNRYIFECIRDDKKRLTKQNYEEELEKVYQRVKNYNFDALWE